MIEKPESEEFDDEADDAVADGDDTDIDSLLNDLGRAKRGTVPQGEPAWRKLEKYREQRETAELVSDFDDYEIDNDLDGSTPPPRRKPRKPL
ncbi:MAG TPA: hypothetical protein VG962_01815 [Steroidobacteraceae bacterium]|jgi:hypothetical protein|nr:hypothetical protein [Steroidobacteraceae bacterium]